MEGLSAIQLSKPTSSAPRLGGGTFLNGNQPPLRLDGGGPGRSGRPRGGGGGGAGWVGDAAGAAVEPTSSQLSEAAGVAVSGSRRSTAGSGGSAGSRSPAVAGSPQPTRIQPRIVQP